MLGEAVRCWAHVIWGGLQAVGRDLGRGAGYGT